MVQRCRPQRRWLFLTVRHHLSLCSRAETPLSISSRSSTDVSCLLLLLLQVVVQLTDDLLSQAVMMVEDSRPTLAINLAGARQHWLEGMLRHEIDGRPS